MLSLTQGQPLWSSGRWSPCRWQQTVLPPEDTWCHTPHTRGPEPRGPSGEGRTWCCWVSPAAPRSPHPDNNNTGHKRNGLETQRTTSICINKWNEKTNNLASLSTTNDNQKDLCHINSWGPNPFETTNVLNQVEIIDWHHWPLQCFHLVPGSESTVVQYHGSVCGCLCVHISFSGFVDIFWFETVFVRTHWYVLCVLLED